MIVALRRGHILERISPPVSMIASPVPYGDGATCPAEKTEDLRQITI